MLARFRGPAVSVPATSLALLPAIFGACSPGYVLRAGWEEAKILRGRRPIEAVVHDTTTPPSMRYKLRLVEDARAFAIRRLGLDASDSFTSYAEVTRDTLLLVVSAAPEFRLVWKTWWFPIVGRVPYRGYFDFERALEEGRRLGEQGYDVWVRPSSAFSTLGWLPDPLLSTTLRADSVALVETVIHEITHTTFFPAGEAHFNESFANFVGHRGAIAFFCRAVADEGRCERARDRWHDTRAFGRFFNGLVDSLSALYATDLPADRMRERKAEILDWAARDFEALKPELRSGQYGSLNPERLNNAWLLARVLYYSRLDDFEVIYESEGDLQESIAAIIAAARGMPPWEAVGSLLTAPAEVQPAGAHTGSGK
ncbi:MAG: aminopeptidase [Gemmatimonadota bacterium]